MKLVLPPLEIDPKKGFTQNDLFGREVFGERLATLVENSGGDVVFALDAPWGEGKSTFIQMWRGHVEHCRKTKTKIKAIYFDAFANDYQKDPFLALAAEFYELAEGDSNKKSLVEGVTNAAKALYRGGMRVGLRHLTAGVVDSENPAELLDSDMEKLIASRLENSAKDKKAIEHFRDCLKELAANAEKPIVFIIDELDRCRPDFALELIEQIKHLFAVPGITFLLVLNRSQLEASIRARYGSDIEATLYLQKFVQVWLSLPRKFSERAGDGDHKKFVRHAIERMRDEEETQLYEATKTLVELAGYFKMSFREIEQALSNFAILQNMMSGGSSDSDFQSLLCFASFLKTSKPTVFSQLLRGEMSAYALLHEIRLPTDESQPSACGDLGYLPILIRRDMKDEEARMNPNQGSNLERICLWLSDLETGYQ